MSELSFRDFTQIGNKRGTNEGGVYEGPHGNKWYLKYPNSERQGQNEVMASRMYREMGFDAIEYRMVSNGMVASEWRDGLPKTSDMEVLRDNDVVQEAFLPSALIANWDVIGLVYDNCLYDPETMDEPVFLDFGGSFDTRAMGGHKQFEAKSIPALQGFRDPSLNKQAYKVFGGMTPGLFEASKRRIANLSIGALRQAVGGSIDGAVARKNRLRSRIDILLDTEYKDVFSGD